MSFYEALKAYLNAEEPVAVVTLVSGEGLGEKILVPLRDPIGQEAEALSTFSDSALDQKAKRAAAQALANNASTTETLSTESGDTEVFIDVHSPRPKLVIVGGVHTAIHLVAFAKELGFATTIVDARATFATRERFPTADELIVEWPATALEAMQIHPETYFAFLSHDPKLDDPALVVACSSRARYIGALGSKKTHEKRKASLRELGLSEDAIAKIHNPIGLKLGGRRPQDIALGVAAQLIQARHGNA